MLPHDGELVSQSQPVAPKRIKKDLTGINKEDIRNNCRYAVVS